jgi:hypothetical protein
MAISLSRVKKEQLRKRRNNLLRRYNKFWLLYAIKKLAYYRNTRRADIYILFTS